MQRSCLPCSSYYSVFVRKRIYFSQFLALPSINPLWQWRILKTLMKMKPNENELFWKRIIFSVNTKNGDIWKKVLLFEKRPIALFSWSKCEFHSVSNHFHLRTDQSERGHKQASLSPAKTDQNENRVVCTRPEITLILAQNCYRTPSHTKNRQGVRIAARPLRFICTGLQLVWVCFCHLISLLRKLLTEKYYWC